MPETKLPEGADDFKGVLGESCVICGAKWAVIVGIEQLPMVFIDKYKGHHVVTLCSHHYGRLRWKTSIRGFTVKNGRLYQYVKESTI